MATTDLKQITPGVFAWQPGDKAAWGMANCGLVVSEGQALVIDTPYTPALTDAFLAAARTAAGPDVPLDRVAVTHANGDHTWGLQQLPGADVFATHATLEHQCLEPKPQQLQTLIHDTDPGQPLGWYFRKNFSRFDFAGIQVLPPTTTFTGRHDLTVGQKPVELHEVGPAHTVGDLIVHLPEQRVVFAGDIVFAGDHPSHWAGPLERVSAACARILELDPEWIIPGHGPLMTAASLQDYVAYLDDLADQAYVMHGQGRTAVEAARILIKEDRYPGLGLPERLAITLSTEYRHLNQDSTAPDLLELMNHAAHIAWDRSTTGPHGI
ncbi:MBL fold metallo-hydrolase [Streptomyces sp. WAC02707]|uniref:MBL fold metallo-hydrolase n=1 Tax=Streptomyces sp. WAC02707 TaxID=2487417 RepID=UPI000F7B160E|nr:MBL fold metallo-hydrolase [Streptomyces sp. WAC02707]RSS85501.1 MBL fold metallo-hydrolase [Streptomyces sp. WAC02707]